MTAVSRQPKRDYVDFSSIPVSQWKMHDRLENWTRWCHGRSGREGGATGVFVLHQSDSWTEREYGAETQVPIDKAPSMARELGLSLAGLAQMVKDSRQMLINRKV